MKSEILLQVNLGKSYYIKGMTKETNDFLNSIVLVDKIAKEYINSKLGISIYDIIIKGTTEYNDELCKKYIQYRQYYDDKKLVIESKCYSIDINSNLLHHRTLQQSWECIIECLGSPEYIVIYAINN
jgi:hypothetical protein